MYVEWSHGEAELGKRLPPPHLYTHNADSRFVSIVVQDDPATHFETLIAHLQQPVPLIRINVPSRLACLTAHSSSSGHTPPLFGPLLFGLGPTALPFHLTHLEFHSFVT